MSTWPDGQRRALTQSQHEEWNGANYPGTRQLCEDCDEPTERCEEDSLYAGDAGPLCEYCYRCACERREI